MVCLGSPDFMVLCRSSSQTLIAKRLASFLRHLKGKRFTLKINIEKQTNNLWIVTIWKRRNQIRGTVFDAEEINFEGSRFGGNSLDFSDCRFRGERSTFHSPIFFPTIPASPELDFKRIYFIINSVFKSKQRIWRELVVQFSNISEYHDHGAEVGFLLLFRWKPKRY